MDLQKLRPTHSQWRKPVASVTEGRIRGTSAPGPLCNAAKQLAHPPKGKGGELWTKFYNDAVARGHPLPEKLADTLLRSRELAMELGEAKHKLKITDKKPGKEEVVVKNAGTVVKKKEPLHEALRCQARTLEGRQCGFRATCGGFCKKHAVKV